VTGVLSGVPPVLQTLVATTFTWGVTALGAALVFGARQVKRRLLDAMLAFAAGVMIFVVAEELVPEAKRGSLDIAALALMVGFAVMMTLDVALS
jgi:zinc transporter, ZIP family